jgi:hypothetical protein
MVYRNVLEIEKEYNGILIRDEYNIIKAFFNPHVFTKSI